MNVHRAEEDYLKIIFKLTVEQNRKLAKTTEIAMLIGNTDQTVNEMVKRLAKKKMIEFIRYKGVSLTKEGLKEAVRLVRNHRLWEVFLVEKLNYSWADVHDEAERLEHASSDMLIDRIDHFLGRPDHCVHGNAIPRRDGSLPKRSDRSLNDLKVDGSMVVRRVVDEPGFLEHMDRYDIGIGTTIKVVEKDDFNGIIKVDVDGTQIVLSDTIAERIYGN